MSVLIKDVAKIDPIISTALSNQNISVIETGSSSPCLDLERISHQVVENCKDVDFVVIEGMGRAIHTNYCAKFSVDSLKIGVFKNPQVAKELGAEMYGGLVKFEQLIA